MTSKRYKIIIHMQLQVNNQSSDTNKVSRNIIDINPKSNSVLQHQQNHIGQYNGINITDATTNDYINYRKNINQCYTKLYIITLMVSKIIITQNNNKKIT